jgi:hypothetical protein
LQKLKPGFEQPRELVSILIGMEKGSDHSGNGMIGEVAPS